MNKENNISWTINEHDRHKKERSWMFVFYIASACLLLYSVLTYNFLFAVIIILVILILILHSNEEPLKVNVELGDEGVRVGKKFHDYDEFEVFSIVYKPKQEIKNLYFEPKSSLSQRISIPLGSTNPIMVQEHLSKYLPEDTERTDPPLSEQLTRLFGL